MIYIIQKTQPFGYGQQLGGEREIQLTCFIRPHYTLLCRYELRIEKIVLYGSLGKIVYLTVLLEYFSFIFWLLSFLVSCCILRISYPHVCNILRTQKNINLIEKLELIQVIIYEEFVFMIYIYIYVRFQFPYKWNGCRPGATIQEFQ